MANTNSELELTPERVIFSMKLIYIYQLQFTSFCHIDLTSKNLQKNDYQSIGCRGNEFNEARLFKILFGRA
jgi:hypothetical protein